MGLKYNPAGAASVLKSQASSGGPSRAGGFPPNPAGGGGGSKMGYSPSGAVSNLNRQDGAAPVRSTGQDCNNGSK